MTEISPDIMQKAEEAMTEFPIQIDTDVDGITISQGCPSPEWSITGKGGRTDMVFISDEQLPALAKMIQSRLNKINQVFFGVPS